jgi:hypothetical protein
MTKVRLNPIYAFVDKEPINILKNWFSNLGLADKCTALTIVDKDLVELFKKMYEVESSHGNLNGRFSTHISDC